MIGSLEPLIVGSLSVIKVHAMFKVHIKPVFGRRDQLNCNQAGREEENSSPSVLILKGVFFFFQFIREPDFLRISIRHKVFCSS